MWKRDDIALIVCNPKKDFAKVNGMTCRLLMRNTSSGWLGSPDRPVWSVSVKGIAQTVHVAEYCLRKPPGGDDDASWDAIERICKWRPDRVSV